MTGRVVQDQISGWAVYMTKLTSASTWIVTAYPVSSTLLVHDKLWRMTTAHEGWKMYLLIVRMLTHGNHTGLRLLPDDGGSDST